MDFADVIKALLTRFSGENWQIKGLVAHPDLTGFREQATDMGLLPVEFIKQRGCGDYGLYEELLFPTAYSDGDGGVLYLHVALDD